MGKGDRYRPVDRERYNRNYDRIFGTDDQSEEVTYRPEHPATPLSYYIKKLFPNSISVFDMLREDEC